MRYVPVLANRHASVEEVRRGFPWAPKGCQRQRLGPPALLGNEKPRLYVLPGWINLAERRWVNLPERQRPRSSLSARASSRPVAAPSWASASNNPECTGPCAELTPSSPCAVAFSQAASRTSGRPEPRSPHFYLVHPVAPVSMPGGRVADKTGRIGGLRVCARWLTMLSTGATHVPCAEPTPMTATLFIAAQSRGRAGL